MAGKKPLFHVAEWEAEQRQKARNSAAKATDRRTKAEKQLADAVRRYNDKIARDIKRGKLTQATAPARLSVREIKKGIDKGLTPLQRGAALSRAAMEIGKRQKRDFSTVRTAAGVQVARAAYEKAKAEYERAKRKQIEEEAKRQAAVAESPKFGGIPVQQPRAWGEGAVPGNPDTAKTFETFVERADAALKYNRAGEWELYRKDLLSNYEKHYYGITLETLKAKLSKISNANLEKAYRAGAKFAQQDYHYEDADGMAIIEMLENMEDWTDM